MRRLHCLLVLSALGSTADLKLSGWVSCSEWSCSKPIQEGIARLNFIGVKTTEDIDWLVIRSGETIVVTGKDAGTYKGQLETTVYLKSSLTSRPTIIMWLYQAKTGTRVWPVPEFGD